MDCGNFATTRRFFAATLIGLTLAGCASIEGGAGDQPEAVVRARATQRWAALLSGSFDKAYAFTTPSYRATVSEEKYRGGFGAGASWVAAKVNSVTCEADRCIANVTITARSMLGMRPGETVAVAVDETWLREDGQWWFFQKL